MHLASEEGKTVIYGAQNNGAGNGGRKQKGLEPTAFRVCKIETDGKLLLEIANASTGDVPGGWKGLTIDKRFGEARLMDAIREVESRTSAEIRICITPKRIWWHERYAWKLFELAGMRKTRNRNAALIVMMPRVKKVVVIGDTGLNSVVDQKYWEETVNAMIHHMKTEGPLAALLTGLHKIGDTLAEFWPRELGNPNELEDEIMQ